MTEIQKSKLNNSSTNGAFQKNFSHSILSRRAFLKLFICFAISWNFDFAVNLVTSLSRQKTLKSKNKKHWIFWNTKFYHPAKFELKRIKIAKVVPTSQYFASYTPTVFRYTYLFMTTYWVSMTLRDTQIYTQIRSRQNLFSGNSLGPSLVTGWNIRVKFHCENRCHVYLVLYKGGGNAFATPGTVFCF